MFDSFKRFWLALIVLLGGGPAVFGFALIGPFNEGWQVPAIGFHIGGDVGAPKNYMQGYRLNTPVLYYTYDDTFLEYFGSNGIAAVDQAFAMYNSLSNVSNLDPNSFPNISSQVNQRAAALGLVDLKSYTMSLLIEQMGLTQPDRFVWVIHNRVLPGGAQCPNYDYLITQRNYDPITYLYSSYVNDILYGYQIQEYCGLNPNPFAPVDADAVEIPVDPLQLEDSFSSVAASVGSDYSILPTGTYFTDFTKDDIGGLKELYSATNAYEETASSNSLQVITNSNVQLLVTQDYGVFLQQALTNPPATLLGLYPGLIITSTTNFFRNVVSTNITAFLTNPPANPYYFVQLRFATNFTTNVQTLYFNTYANVEVVHQYPKGFVTQQTTSLQSPPFSTAGTVAVVVSNKTTVQNFTNGDFYILPANLCGPYQILATQLVTIVTNFNFIPIATNGVTITTNTTGLPISVAILTYFTNYSLLVHEVDCGTNLIGLHEGIEHVQFVRRDFDSLLGRFFAPITNYYHITTITNGGPVVQTFQRIVTAPDILITAQDLTAGPADITEFVSYAFRTAPHFNQSQIPQTQVGGGGGQAIGGPGTIEPRGIVLTYNSVGPIYEAAGSPPLENFPTFGGVFYQTNAVYLFQWGSFDGTTNDPVIYPNSLSLANLEASLFFQITSGQPPAGSTSVPYNFQLQATGASSPVNWTVVSNSLPSGLMLSSDGLISGMPQAQGLFDFTVKAAVQSTDTNAPMKQLELVIAIGP